MSGLPGAPRYVDDRIRRCCSHERSHAGDRSLAASCTYGGVERERRAAPACDGALPQPWYRSAERLDHTPGANRIFKFAVKCAVVIAVILAVFTEKSFQYFADGILTIALIWIAKEDIFRFRVSNKAIAGLCIGFVVICLVSGRPNLFISHVLLSITALICLIGAFAARMIGGGDAKLLSVALLWLGPEHVFVFALLLLVTIFTYGVGARFFEFPSRRLNGSLRIPLAPCVSVAWIATLILWHSFY